MKVDGQEVVQAPDHEEPKILNLMDALKKSVAEAQAASRPSGEDVDAGDADEDAAGRQEARAEQPASKKRSKQGPGRVSARDPVATLPEHIEPMLGTHRRSVRLGRTSASS